MSDKTPPSGEPTPTPDEPSEGHGTPTGEEAAPPPPAEETTVDGSAPPPPPADETTVDGSAPPPPPAETVAGAYAPPPPAAKKSRTPWIIAVAVVLVLALVGGAVAVIVSLTGEDTHSIAIPANAGGMKRDTTKENELKQQLDAAEQQFKTQAKNVTYVKSGVYNQADKDRGPEGALVFLGAKLDKEQSPQAFVDAFGKQAGANGFKIDKISAGEAGGQAVCASQDAGQKIAICAWATKDSMGELIPTVPGWDSKQLAKVMLDVRKDVEKTD